MSIEATAKYWFWSEPFYRNLKEFSARPAWSYGLRGHHREEAYIYGSVLAAQLDRDTEADAEAYERRSKARDHYFSTRAQIHDALIDGDGIPWNFHGTPLTDSQQAKVEAIEVASIEALKAWVEA